MVVMTLAEETWVAKDEGTEAGVEGSGRPQVGAVMRASEHKE